MNYLQHMAQPANLFLERRRLFVFLAIALSALFFMSYSFDTFAAIADAEAAFDTTATQIDSLEAKAWPLIQKIIGAFVLIYLFKRFIWSAIR